MDQYLIAVMIGIMLGTVFGISCAAIILLAGTALGILH